MASTTSDVRAELERTLRDADLEAQRAVGYADALRTLVEIGWSTPFDAPPVDLRDIERSLTGELLARWRNALDLAQRTMPDDS